VEPDEIKGRKFGPSTRQALKAIRAKLGLPQGGHITEDLASKLREAALETKLSTKTQVAQVQRTLLRALLPLPQVVAKARHTETRELLDAAELRRRQKAGEAPVSECSDGGATGLCRRGVP
jgi:hypothetical protein